jgi:hypothetical protein
VLRTAKHECLVTVQVLALVASVHGHGRLARRLIQIIVVLTLLGLPRTGYAQPASLRIGQQVEAVGQGTGIYLRAAPGLAGRVVRTVPNGTAMVVVDGPQTSYGFTWWQIDGAPGWGWAAEGVLRPVRQPASSRLASGDPRCVATGRVYPGLYHCLRPGDVHVVVIDLDDPHVRFETVMAQDAPSVDSPRQEWVSDMAARYPGAAAAINGDYFVPGQHGPEGLTIKNGVRLDSLTTTERSALVIGQAPLDNPAAALPIPAGIMRLGPAGQPPDPRVYYNAVGGGPQVMFDGAWEWTRGWLDPRYRGCGASLAFDDIINGECFPNTGDWLDPLKLWTAVGLTANHKMIWVVAPYQRLAGTLAAFGAQTAIKLDSGGSSQLWYQRPQVPGFRPVGNGLLAFYLGAARVIDEPQWPVVLEQQPLSLRLTLENAGAETWTAGDYALVNESGAWGGPARLPLPRDVRPGERVTLQWEAAGAEAGVQHSVWRLARVDRPFPGDPVVITAVVLPPSLEPQQREIETLVRAELPAGAAALELTLSRYIRQSATIGH